MNIKDLNDTDRKRVENLFGTMSKRVQIADAKYVGCPPYKYWHERYQQFECRKSDIWVISFPKSGTTWTQEMVWCILNNFNYEGSKKEVLMKRFPFFEWDSLLPEDITSISPLPYDDPCAPGETWKILHTLNEPRTIKSHLHMEILPLSILAAKSKIIYVCRDPKDVCVSYYYHSLKLDGFLGSFDEFFDLFLDELLFFAPYWKHVLDFWKIRDNENVLFIRYEELKEDLAAGIKKVSSFLKRFVPEEELVPLMEHLSFNKMKGNSAVNNEAIMQFSSGDNQKIPFMRSGKVGDWKSHMSQEQLERMKMWTESHLKDTDFPFYRD